MKLIIGLGNPGLRYKNTRHNVGFLVVKELSRELDISPRRKKHGGYFGKGVVDGKKVSLFMPASYMNLSGHPISEALRKEKIPVKNCLVICDDVNLQLGYIRLRKKGSSGGHKGLKSIIECLATDEFSRLRVGIGGAGTVGDLAKFVLRPFGSSEKKPLHEAVKSASECALLWINEGPEKAMTLFNRRQFA